MTEDDRPDGGTSEDRDSSPGSDSNDRDDVSRGDQHASSDEEGQSETDEDSFTTPTRNKDSFDSKLNRSERFESDSIVTQIVARAGITPREALSIGDRSVLQKYLPAIFAVFLLITAAGGFLVYGAQTAPETTTETQTTGTWSANATFTHAAVVTNGTFTFTEGQRLEDRSLYFTRVSPELTGEYLVTHRGDAETASGTVDLRLVLEAIDESGGSDQGETTEPPAYWRETRPIDSVSIDSLEPGETRRVSFDADVAELNERVTAIEDALGASPGTTRIAVVAETTLEASVADDRFVDTRTDRLALEPSQGTYSVSSSLTESQTYEATETIEVPAGPTPLQQYGGPVLIIVGVVGMVATGSAWREDTLALTDPERVRLEYSQARSDLDKWISVGTVPPREGRTIVELSSLRDLANVAIDSDRRVIERPDATPRFVVLDDDVRYIYDPPAAARGEDTDDSPAVTGGTTPDDRTRDPSRNAPPDAE
ncbi:hypothetical protein EXE52_08735 [Halorubrum sp. CGM4_25_10-8A]|nr:hypothetical protein EXE52_08735 [Halorubrum sp. CGM4_25_10-8A]